MPTFFQVHALSHPPMKRDNGGYIQLDQSQVLSPPDLIRNAGGYIHLELSDLAPPTLVRNGGGYVELNEEDVELPYNSQPSCLSPITQRHISRRPNLQIDTNLHAQDGLAPPPLLRSNSSAYVQLSAENFEPEITHSSSFFLPPPPPLAHIEAILKLASGPER